MSLPSQDEIIDDLTEAQVKFILKASVIAGHLSSYWLEKAIELSKGLRHD